MKAIVVLLSVIVCVELAVLLTPTTHPPAIQNSSKVLLAERLSQVSVMVTTPKGLGTGTILTRRTKDGKKLHLVLTAAHVVENCRRVVPSANGPKVTFDPVKVNVMLRHDGRLVRQTVYSAEIIQYSNADTGRDLAILKIVDPSFPDINTEFHVTEIPMPGTAIYHCGSMFGLSDSFTAGYMSQVGCEFMGRTYDQVAMTIYPGSSGGGVFLEDGRCIGVAVLLRAPGVGLIVPAREVEAWAVQAGCRWLLNPSIKIDSAKLAKWPVENDGSALPLDCDPDPGPTCGRR